MQRELNLDYLLNEPRSFVQDYYLRKAQISEDADSSLDQAKVRFDGDFTILT